jgi:uncharacterized protein (DUF1697 family)
MFQKNNSGDPIVFKNPGVYIQKRLLTTYILLLRGVTPSGKNKVPMAQFREVLKKAGFAHVRTYIQSGNALVDSELPAHEVEKEVRELIRDQIGPDLVVIARTGVQRGNALEGNPFTKGFDIPRVFFVSFMKNTSGTEGERSPVSGSHPGKTCLG